MGNIIDVEMKELGENMVKHCAGLPLAIVVLGGILATKNNSLGEWRNISDNVKSYLIRGKNQGLEDVLALSYDDLPPYLRPCFLYLSHFPEDYMIDVDRLIQLWVAEGVVSSKQEERDGGEIAEDVAEFYLMELVERCMIQVRERDVATLKVKTIQMHDLMRDLCLSKAKQENFVFIVDRSNASSLSMIRKVRRISVHEFFFIQCIKSPNIRSLLFFNQFLPVEALKNSLPSEVVNYVEEHQDEVWKPLFWILTISAAGTVLLKARGIWRHMFNNFKLLRALNYERTGNLRCMQTLDLRVNDYNKVHVPNVIWRMEQLRHLYLPDTCKKKTKLKLGSLRKLLTLVNFNTKNCYLQDLINMTNLRELVIRGPFKIESFNEKELGENPPIIGRFPKLESLILAKLYFLREREVDEGAMPSLQRLEIRRCPGLTMLPEGLRKLVINGAKQRGENIMPTLEKLPNLRILEFKEDWLTGCFLQITIKRLEDMELEEWEVSGLAGYETPPPFQFPSI
ncbi:hypothetical protein J1N35_023799 [Gossypium stocksii]|uniref:NB-ARC domain-containing protein n=1 Tax=Gossypium stocksii TaxID=47602 RepID=A0A9D4A3I7_9ROSI|nr:hypothetical protein J1N35_023799 [Gossypium stocksii]